MCLVFVSLNEQGVRSGILAQASARRPEVESGIHLVCLVFSGGSIPSDKGRGGGGGAVVQTLRWGGGAEAPPNISNTGAEGSATSRTLVNFFRLLQNCASSAPSGERLC